MPAVNWPLIVLLGLPFLAFIPAFTPPEWWWSLHDDSSIALSGNVILSCELRMGLWEQPA